MELFKHKKLAEFEKLKSKNEDGRRVYLTPSGEKYPSITSVLGYFKKASIQEWRDRVGAEEANKISTQSSRRGTAVHQICEDYLNNKDYTLKHMPSNLAMFRTLKPILDENIKTVYHQEVPLYSDKLQIAGRVDCVCNWNGEDAIVDFKTSRKIKKRAWITDYFLQGTAYSLMFESLTGIHIPKIVIVMAIDNEKPAVYEESIYQWTAQLLDKIERYKAYVNEKRVYQYIQENGALI